MNKHELIQQLNALAEQCREEYPKTAIVLFALCGAMHGGTETELALAAGDCAQRQVARIQAMRN